MEVGTVYTEEDEKFLTGESAIIYWEGQHSIRASGGGL